MSKRAPLICRNGCGTAIWFDWERKYDDLGYTQNSTKPNIPLEVADDGEHLPKKHQCPNSEYAKKQQQGGSAGETKATIQDEALKAILGNTLDVIARIDILEKSVSEMGKDVAQSARILDAWVKGKLGDGNPLDDDGDSSRENGESPEQ